MKPPKGTPLLSMDSPSFTEDFASAIGLKPGEKLEIATPQFHRIDGVQVSSPNLTPDEWDNLGKLPIERVRQMGCQIWEDDAKGIHWLFPGQWYQHIPNGTKILSICGEEGIFVLGETDDDIQFGALAYGFLTQR
jgi:hypothetical protein